MFTSSRSVFAGVALSIFLGLPAAARADHVIDSFTNELPDRILPGTSSPSPVMWAGRMGADSQALDIASQINLSGVAGGQRTTKVREATLSNFVTAYVGGGQLNYATGLAPSGALTLEYGVTTPLNLNLTADRAFALDLDGDLNDGTPRPVYLTITVRAGSFPAVSKTYKLLADGAYRFAFSDFPYVNWADVDYIKLNFDAAQVSGIDYVLSGGLRTVCGLY